MYIIVFNTNSWTRDDEFYDYLKEKINGRELGLAKIGNGSYLVPNSKDITIDYLHSITFEFVNGRSYRECAFIAEITENTMCVHAGKLFKRWFEKHNRNTNT